MELKQDNKTQDDVEISGEEMVMGADPLGTTKARNMLGLQNQSLFRPRNS